MATFSAVFRGARFSRDRSAELGLPRGGSMTGGRGFVLEYMRGATRITALWLADETVAIRQAKQEPGHPNLAIAERWSIDEHLPRHERSAHAVGMDAA